MTLDFNTVNSDSLKNNIIKIIKDENLKTWEIHNFKGNEYIKHVGQWGDKGVIELTSKNNNVQLNVQVLKFKSTDDKVEDFEGYYLGRFCELMFVNFEDEFTSIYKS